MSSLSVLRSILSSSSKLFDRFININLISATGKKYAIITPRSGPKPNIAVQLETLPSNMTTKFTISLMNFTAAINLNLYTTVEVTMGYYSSNDVYSFTGTVLHVFQESPNPNGILTLQGELGNTAVLSSGVLITLQNSPVPLPAPAFIQSVVAKINAAIQTVGKGKTHGLLCDVTKLPVAWMSAMVDLNGSTEQFGSIYSAISWLNSVLLSLAYDKDKKLPPLFVYVEDGKIVFSSTVSKGTGPTLTMLTKVNNVYAAGKEIVITCPFVPSIKSETFFYLNAQYYTAVLNVSGISGLNPTNLIKANYTEVKFSTNGTNEMRINGIKVDEILKLDDLYISKEVK